MIVWANRGIDSRTRTHTHLGRTFAAAHTRQGDATRAQVQLNLAGHRLQRRRANTVNDDET